MRHLCRCLVQGGRPRCYDLAHETRQQTARGAQHRKQRRAADGQHHAQQLQGGGVQRRQGEAQSEVRCGRRWAATCSGAWRRVRKTTSCTCCPQDAGSRMVPRT